MNCFSAAHSKNSFALQLGPHQADSLGHSSVLDALLAAGMQVPYDCRGGSCGQCRLKLLSGQCQMVLPAEYELAADEILSCCMQAQSPLATGLLPANNHSGRGESISDSTTATVSARRRTDAPQYPSR